MLLFYLFYLASKDFLLDKDLLLSCFFYKILFTIPLQYSLFTSEMCLSYLILLFYLLNFIILNFLLETDEEIEDFYDLYDKSEEIGLINFDFT
jgi:hypothetical protein